MPCANWKEKDAVRTYTTIGGHPRNLLCTFEYARSTTGSKMSQNIFDNPLNCLHEYIKLIKYGKYEDSNWLKIADK